MRRKLFNIIAVVSILLCVTACALWWRSCGTFDDLCRAEPRTCINVVSLRGKLYLQFASADGEVWSHDRDWHTAPRQEVLYYAGPYTWRVAGFAKGYRTKRLDDVSLWEHILVVPYWALVALFGALPVQWFWRVRCERVRRARREGAAEPGAAPNGGPAERVGNASVGGGPPSVS